MSAKTDYGDALRIKPRESYPKNKLLEIKKIFYTASVASNTTPKPEKKSIELTDFATKEEFMQELAKQYPQGVTEEVFREGNKSITKRIVVLGNEGNEYRMVKHDWGGKFYFKNGMSITLLAWNKETVL